METKYGSDWEESLPFVSAIMRTYRRNLRHPHNEECRGKVGDLVRPLVVKRVVVYGRRGFVKKICSSE